MYAKKRRKQKRIAQTKYLNKTRDFQKLKYRAKRENKQVLFTFDEYTLIKKDTCNICKETIKSNRHGIGLIDPLKNYELNNIFTVCNLCIKKRNKSFNLWAFCKKILRKYSRRNPAFALTKERARIKRGFYICNICKKEQDSKNIEVDHISPVSPVEETKLTLDEYAIRLYCSADNLQVLCKPCHLAKTTIENELRYSYKQRNKK